MDEKCKIRLKKLSDLIQQSGNSVESKTLKGKYKEFCEMISDSGSDFADTNVTPKRAKNQKVINGGEPTTSKKSGAPPNASKRITKSNKKDPPPSQTRIDSFFKSCSKIFQVEDLSVTNGKLQVIQTTGRKLQKTRGKNVRNMIKVRGRGRKRLFDDATETDTDTTTEPSCISGMTPKKPVRKRFVKNSANKSEKNILPHKKSSTVEFIDLISESEDEKGKPKEELVEKEQLKSESTFVIQTSYADFEETTPLSHVNISEKIPTLEISGASTCQTNGIPNVMQQQSSGIEEDIGTLIQNVEIEHEQVTVRDEKELPKAYLSNAEALLHTVDSGDHQLLPCHTNNPPVADIGTINSASQHQISEIEDIGTLIQKVEKEEHVVESKSILNAQFNVELRDNSVSQDQSSEIEAIIILGQKEEEEEHKLKLQSVLNGQGDIVLRDNKTLQKASSLVYVSSGEEDFLLPLSRFQINKKNVKHKTNEPVRKNLIYVSENKTSKEATTFPTIMPVSNSTNTNPEKPFSETNEATTSSVTAEEARTKAGTRKRKPRPCPSYKVVRGTTFAVDAFQFGLIKGVTHYFLSHFHADHYVGLTRKFAMPLFCSPVTARLLRVFIPLEECFVHEIELNQPQIVEGVEVTAIDANHCPGAVMFLFKLQTGKCILHTGDFRASPNMESEPIFWNNDIHTIYLDTTYISNKYAFSSQDESIDEAQHLIEQFQEKHKDKRILYICGAYLIGKERMWSSLARNNRLVVWTEPRRNKALKAMQDLDYLELLCANSISATMHVIALGKLSYLSLVEYFEPYSSQFDICLAIRPSGWEKNSKPQYRGKINIIGVEYSEHSSYNELQRFVTYLNPQEVISTVPTSSNLMITSEVPQAWYKYRKFPTQHRNFQPSISNYLKLKTKKSLSLKQNEESSKENFLPNQSSQSDEFEDMKCSLKVSTDKLFLLHAAGDADDDWLS